MSANDVKDIKDVKDRISSVLHEWRNPTSDVKDKAKIEEESKAIHTINEFETAISAVFVTEARKKSIVKLAVKRLTQIVEAVNAVLKDARSQPVPILHGDSYRSKVAFTESKGQQFLFPAGLVSKTDDIAKSVEQNACQLLYRDLMGVRYNALGHSRLLSADDRWILMPDADHYYQVVLAITANRRKSISRIITATTRLLLFELDKRGETIPPPGPLSYYLVESCDPKHVLEKWHNEETAAKEKSSVRNLVWGIEKFKRITDRMTWYRNVYYGALEWIRIAIPGSYNNPQECRTNLYRGMIAHTLKPFGAPQWLLDCLLPLVNAFVPKGEGLSTNSIAEDVAIVNLSYDVIKSFGMGIFKGYQFDEKTTSLKSIQKQSLKLVLAVGLRTASAENADHRKPTKIHHLSRASEALAEFFKLGRVARKSLVPVIEENVWDLKAMNGLLPVLYPTIGDLIDSKHPNLPRSFIPEQEASMFLLKLLVLRLSDDFVDSREKNASIELERAIVEGMRDIPIKEAETAPPPQPPAPMPPAAAPAEVVVAIVDSVLGKHTRDEFALKHRYPPKKKAKK